MTTPTHFWVLRDLSNGDGADGRPRPTYIWAFLTRDQARRARRLHESNEKFSDLGPVEYWPAENVLKHYRAGEAGSVGEHYYRRIR